MNWKKWIISFGLLIIINYSSYGLDTLSIRSDFQKMDLKEISDVFWSNNEAESIQRVREIKNEVFKPLRETGVSFPASEKVYWVKTIIKNEDVITRQFVVKIDNPRINKLRFFTVKDSIVKASKLMGDDFPFQQRTIKNRNFLYPIILQPNETIDLYIYANKAGESMNLFMSFWDKFIFEEEDNQEVTFWGFYVGFAACICLTVLLITIFTRLKLLVYFTIYCFAINFNIISWLGLGYKYIWSNFPYFNDISGYTFLAIYSVCLLAITRNYLKTAIVFPKIDKILLAHQIGIIVLSPILISYKILPKFLVAISIQTGNIIISSYLIFIIIATIMTYQKTKDKFKLLFLLGFFFFIVGFGLHLSLSLNTIDSNILTRYGPGIGWILDLIILMVVFSNQIRQAFLKNIELNQELNQTKFAAANALLEGQLEERQRLSSELHDGISIQMALLKMRMDNLFIKKTTEEQGVLKSLTDISQDIRAFTHAIAPLDLDNETLEDAIENLVYKIENQTNLSVKLHLSNLEEEKLQKNQKYALYQTLQELFNNTIKYAEASQILINLQSSQRNVKLFYQDNGKGFDINGVKTGIGLSNIQARADLFNGYFEINSTKNGSRFEFSFSV